MVLYFYVLYAVDKVLGVVDMMGGFSHKGFENSCQFFCTLICCCSPARYDGSQGYIFFVHFWQPIILGSACPCRIKFYDKVECDEEYIGESARIFAERFKEHQKAPSPIHDHSIRSGHEVNIDNFSIVGREDQNLTRTIKEALYIRVNNPSLNKNIGKYHLPHIWDEVLCNSPELKLK